MTKASVLVDRDRLNHAPKRDVASTCVRLFDAIQGMAKEKQLLGLACAFLILAEAAALPAQDVFTASKNLMADPISQTGRAPEFAAMRFHLDTEVLR